MCSQLSQGAITRPYPDGNAGLSMLACAKMSLHSIPKCNEFNS